MNASEVKMLEKIREKSGKNVCGYCGYQFGFLFA
jgi:hypothetical protein